MESIVLHDATEGQLPGGMLAWQARVFGLPSEVAASPALTLEEKREILASWASDACAVESAPALCLYPGTNRPVQVDAVIAALRSLDLEHRYPARRPLAAREGFSGPIHLWL